MPGEEGFVERDVLDTNDAFVGFVFNYPVDHQKRIAVRQYRLDLCDVQ